MIFYTDQGDTPINCTNKDELGFVREGVVGERKNPKMKVGGKYSVSSIKYPRNG